MKKLYLILFCVMASLAMSAQNYNPKANDDAVITSGNMRFTVLTPELIRIQYSANGTFEDRATFGIVNRNLPVPSFTTREESGCLYVTTSALELRYKIGARPNPATKTPTNLQITLTVNGQPEVWYPGKEDALNLRGTMRTLDNVSGDTQRNRLENGVISRSGWALVDESPATERGDGSVSFPLEPQAGSFDWVAPHADASAYDWYFFGYGHDYKKALGDFSKVAGSIPLPPKYMFGYWYSRYWAYTSNEFMQIVRDVENNDIPMDVMIFDMDWHKPGWTGWSWNPDLIPNPKTLLQWMHRHNLKVALNLHPADGVGSHEDDYQALHDALGYDSSFRETIQWRIENREFYQAMFDNIIRKREGEGVDFWWLDWQQRTVGGHANEHHYTLEPGLDKLGETFWHNHVFYNDMVENRPDRRPVIYHRWGGMGSHRYPIGFSGDTYANWATLQWQPYFTSTASNVGWGYWGHDLGGHQADPDNDPERYLRWMQFGVFTPIFRTHATNDWRIERRIWMFPNFPQLRETVVLRYALFPYIYTAARQSFDTGICINRPLYYDYPEANNAYRFEDEYMFGDNILVAPLTTAGEGEYAERISKRTTWLPQGTWFDVAKNQLVKGDVIYTDSYTLDEIPYYYKAGSVIVNYPYQRTVQTTPETIILKVTPGGDGTGSFYEDNGDDAQYADHYAMTTFSSVGTDSKATLSISAREGAFEEMPTVRTYQAEFLGAEGNATSVTVNGNAVSDYSYDADKKVITVSIPVESFSQAMTVVVDAPFQTAKTLTSGYDPQTPDVKGTPKFWAIGSAVPGGIQPLESFPNGQYKFHGTLNPGELYIIDTEGETSTTRYYAPAKLFTNIVNEGSTVVNRAKKETSEWVVTASADNYRFTYDSAKKTLRGEMFPWLLELYIGGGCTAPNQSEKWYTELFVPLQNLDTDKNIWTGIVELKNYAGNEQPKRFKLMAQKDWGPISFHPFTQDEEATSASQFCIGGDDNKWSISKDGYYQFTVDAFRETIRIEYLGEDKPSGMEHIVSGVLDASKIYNVSGVEQGTLQHGVNILRDSKGNSKKVVK